MPEDIFKDTVSDPGFQEYLIKLRNLKNKYNINGNDASKPEANEYANNLYKCGVVEARRGVDKSDKGVLNLGTNRFGGDRCRLHRECWSGYCAGKNRLMGKWGICNAAAGENEVFEALGDPYITPYDDDGTCGERSVPGSSGGYKRRKHSTRKQKKLKKKSKYHRKSRRGKRRKTSKKTKHNRRRKNKSVRRR